MTTKTRGGRHGNRRKAINPRDDGLLKTIRRFEQGVKSRDDNPRVLWSMPPSVSSR